MQEVASRVCLLSAERNRQKGQIPTHQFFDVRVEPGFTSLEAALSHLRLGRNVGATIICTQGGQTGGELLSSGMLGGPEEVCSMRSDIHPSLLTAGSKAEEENLTNSRGHTPYIPELGAAVCRNVRILRDGQENGFAPYREPIMLPAAICISLANLNPHQDTTAEKRIELKQFDKQRYAASIGHKFDMVLKAAYDLKLEAVTVSDLACKRLHNDGHLLGRALGEAMLRAKFVVPRVILSGSTSFIAATKQVIKDRSIVHH
jgi:hypothetical protein